MPIRKHVKTGLLIAFAIETLCATWGLKLQSYIAVFSVVWFLAGITIAFLILLLPQAQPPEWKKINFNSAAVYGKLALFTGMAVFMYFIPQYWFSLIQLDIDYADMLPVISTMNQRFLNGQWKHIYDPIPEIWNSIKPVYLPAMWLPFSPALIFNFDIRWITVACLFIVFSIFLLLLRFGRKRLSAFFLLVIAFALFWWMLAQDDVHYFISMSEEGVVVLYYALLVLALLRGNIVFIGIAASLCMLSRYALIGWIPAFLFFLLLNKRKKEAALFTITGVLCFLILFILPFGWPVFVQLVQLPGNYIEFAKIVWQNSREVFWLSLGFAKFFGPQGTGLLHKLLISLTFIVPFLFVAGCHYLGRKKRLSNVPLAALKLSVVVFYSFIDVPYLYLFYTSSFMSLLIVAYFTNCEEETVASASA